MVALLLVSMEAWYRGRFIEEVEMGSGGAQTPQSFCFLLLTMTAGPMGEFPSISKCFLSWNGEGVTDVDMLGFFRGDSFDVFI